MPDLLFVVLAPSLPFTDQPNGSFVTAVVAWGFIGFVGSFAMRLVLQGGSRSKVLTNGGDPNTNPQAPGDSSQDRDFTSVKTLEDSNRIDVALKRATLEFHRFARTEAVCPICLKPLTVERAADLGQIDIRCPCGSCKQAKKGSCPY
jgi:hypothetical protein